MEAKLKGEMGDLLYDASQKGDLDAAKRTISQLKASNPAYKPPFSSILRAATSKDRANVVKYCLDHSTPVIPELLLDTNAIDVNYYIPWFGDMLSNAATHDDFEMATICLSHGADPNANHVDEHMSILAAVADLASVGMARLLLEHGARLRGSGAIVKAAEAGKLEMVRVLLEDGADVNEVGNEHPTDPRYNEDMGTALHRAVVEGHEEIDLSPSIYTIVKMPEIGEVARIVNYIHKHLVGKTLAKVKAQHDENVYGKVGCSAEAFEKALTGKKVLDAKQQGKYFWMVMSSPPHPLMHFGMAGWLKIRDEETAYYKPTKPEESPEWPPKYWKFVLETAEEPKREAAFVDLRRFARIRLIDCAADQIRNVSPLVENGPDPVIDKGVVTEEWLAEKLRSKRVPVKALLLDQQNISGIGNWVGDEIMYDAKIHPEQYSNALTPAQIKQLHKSIHYICSFAVDNLADSSKFPEEWLFKHRWGKGKKDSSTILPNGSKFVYLTVGGRTSCVVPSVQKKTGPVAGDVKDEAGTEDADGEKKAKSKSRKKAPKPKKEKTQEEEAKPAKESSKGNKRTAKTVDEEPAVNGHKPDEEASKPASKKRKANTNANANGAMEPKKQSKGNADKNGTSAKSEPEKSERRRSGRVSGKAA